MLAWVILAVTVPLIAGMRVRAGVVVSVGVGLLALGILNGTTSVSTIGMPVSLVLFWTAGVCFAIAAREAGRRRKLVRS
jgi:hypothetical protein